MNDLSRRTPCALFFSILLVWAAPTQDASAEENPARANNPITGNPAASTVMPGNGQLGRWIGIPEDSGVRIGGVWAGDLNVLMAGGKRPGSVTWNSLLQVGLNLDFEKLIGWDGLTFGSSFLRTDFQNTNSQAGSIQGYNSLVATAPLSRSELYTFWINQTFLDDRIRLRIGKVIPSVDFNLNRPLPTSADAFAIPSVTGLLFTPIFTQPSLLGVLPGYPNSAWGVTLAIVPSPHFSFTYGIYDGRGALGVQTGLQAWPQFKGSYFQAAEITTNWAIPGRDLLGNFGIGGWLQTGPLKNAGIEEEGAAGFYLYASQTLWQGHRSRPAERPRESTKNPKEPVPSDAVTAPDQAVLAWAQFGMNNSETLIMNQSVGGGLTAFGLVPGRPEDSFGAGVSTAWLNERIFERKNELMFQLYYQASIADGFFIEPAFTYIPTPGASTGLGAAWAFTLRTTLLF